MIDKMTKYSFILLSGENEEFLGKLQELGVVDITRSEKPVDEKSSAMLEKVSGIQKAISILEELDYSQDADFEKISVLSKSIEIEGCKKKNTLEAVERLNALNAEIAAEQKELESLIPWGDFDSKSLDFLKEKGLELHFYSIPKKKFDPQWAEKWPLQVVQENKDSIWFVTVSRQGDEYYLPIQETSAPSTSALEAEKRIAALKEETIVQKARLLCIKDNFLPHMHKGLARHSAELDKYLASEVAVEAAEGHISTFIGFAPVSENERLAKAFEAMGILFLSEDATVEDNPPIQLRNNRFVAMFEVLTDMYGRPVYNGFDPTVFISIFFMLFFAMCMGDAGYGIVLVAGGILLKKVKSFASLSPLVTILGIATVVVGFFFHTFFSMDMSQWTFIQNAGIDKVMVPAKIAGYDGTMVVAIAVGIIHLCLAMIVRTVNATKNKGFMGSLSIWGWTLFLVGTVMVLAAGLAFHIDSSITKWVIIVLGAVAAIGIFPLRNPDKNPLVNIGGGLWETYNTATGVLGDVLSYLRLYALGLAGSMLGFAFNTLAVMSRGDGGLGWIPFILIALIGHVLNIAMAVLGAFVHPLRLNFLEFFKNSDYDGSGRSYKPLKK